MRYEFDRVQLPLCPKNVVEWRILGGRLVIALTTAEPVTAEVLAKFATIVAAAETSGLLGGELREVAEGD